MRLTPLQRAYLRKSTRGDRFILIFQFNNFQINPTIERMKDVVDRFESKEMILERFEMLREMDYDGKSIDEGVRVIKNLLTFFNEKSLK